MNTPHDIGQRAIAWTELGAQANPGIQFIAIIPSPHYHSRQRLHWCEVRTATPEPWPAHLELDQRDGAEGRWVWDDDLDKFTKMEDA